MTTQNTQPSILIITQSNYLCHQDHLTITSDKQTLPGSLMPCLAIYVSEDITIHEKWKFHYSPTVKYILDNRMTDLLNKPQP